MAAGLLCAAAASVRWWANRRSPSEIEEADAARRAAALVRAALGSREHLTALLWQWPQSPHPPYSGLVVVRPDGTIEVDGRDLIDRAASRGAPRRLDAEGLARLRSIRDRARRRGFEYGSRAPGDHSELRFSSFGTEDAGGACRRAFEQDDPASAAARADERELADLLGVRDLFASFPF